MTKAASVGPYKNKNMLSLAAIKAEAENKPHYPALRFSFKM